MTARRESGKDLELGVGDVALPLLCEEERRGVLSALDSGCGFRVLCGEDLQGLFVLVLGERALGGGFDWGFDDGLLLEVDGEDDFGALEGEHDTRVFRVWGQRCCLYGVNFFIF